MLLRNINVNDNDKVFELGSKLFREEDEIPYFKKALETYIKDLSYVIYDNEKLAGFILICKKMTKVYKKFMTKIPNCYELSFFGINQEYQGKGYGSQCLSKALLSIYQICSQFNCWLIVDHNNYGAIKMYQKFGFRKWSIVYHDKYPGIIMGLSHRRWRTYGKN